MAVSNPRLWSIEVFDLSKHFASREGLPQGWGMGDAHWIISSIIKYGKSIRCKKAVDGVTFRVKNGELFGLLGPNGAGKTTLLKCLSTLLKTDGGQAFVNGYDINEEPDNVKLSINLVGSGQWVAFDWGMTVEQNLDFFGALYGQSKSERRANREMTLKLLGLEHIAKRTPRNLSSGERQRMLLAKGFAVRTPVFFLDEPSASLDPHGAREVRNFIRKELMGNTDTTVVLTTHRMSEAEELCDRIAIMDQGKIIACGTLTELKEKAGDLISLEIRCLYIPREALEALRSTEGITAAAVSTLGEESRERSLRVHLLDSSLEAPVVDTLKRHGASLVSIEREEPTLEDAFLALTKRRLD